MAEEKGKRRKRRRQTYAPDNPTQSRKFIEAAKRLGVDQDEKAFRKATRNLRRTKPKG